MYDYAPPPNPRAIVTHENSVKALPGGLHYDSESGCYEVSITRSKEEQTRLNDLNKKYSNALIKNDIEALKGLADQFLEVLKTSPSKLTAPEMRMLNIIFQKTSTSDIEYKQRAESIRVERLSPEARCVWEEVLNNVNRLSYNNGKKNYADNT